VLSWPRACDRRSTSSTSVIRNPTRSIAVGATVFVCDVCLREI
jgi:hypothetical protein